MRHARLAFTLSFALTLTACGPSMEETFSEVQEGLGDTDGGASASSCEPLPADELAVLTDAWTGSGNLTVTAAQRAPSSGTSFTHVIYVQADAPGIEGEVFVFAVDGGDLTNPSGLLVGADTVTREFFEWGAAATPGSPMANEASAAVDGAPRCLP